ncbi:MAG TPA: flagellar hook-associated protein FlgL [Tepidisphaeraceae bacterium]|nr:flagellar hook-associated protein FlgL [Tepidisphaeraceae bacterium]
MNISPLQFARVSNLLSSSVSQSQITATQKDLLNVENQLSTGQRLTQPSDDPGAASATMQLQKTLDQRNAYLGNLSQGQSQLGEVDNTLSSLTALVQQAQNIASANVGSDVTAQQRQGAAAVVSTLFDQAVGLANTQFNGAYLFAGDKSTTAPYVATNGGVQFVGSTNVLQNVYDTNTTLPFTINGASIFGGLSSQVKGSAVLTPNLTSATRLTDLRGAMGNGVHLGSILLGNGSTTKLVDLSTADSAGDVVNAINAAGLGGITASITGKGFTLSTSGADNITVQDVGGGTTAADLGISKTTGGGAGAPVVGASTQPNITVLTSLSALNGGAGIDATHGLKITNGTQTASISLAGATTVGDVINAVNASGTGAVAQINSTGNGLNILNNTQGTQLSISENGGTTAADLGVRSFGTTTRLSDLNGGKGIQFATGGPDLQITNSAGANFTVSLTGAVTVQDVITKINAAGAGANVAAGFSNVSNGITLTDTSGGSGALSVASINFSTAAADLGLTTTPVGNTLTGTDVNPVIATGVFGDIAKLRDALTNNDSAGITNAAQGLANDYSQAVTVRAQAGAQVQEMAGRQSRLQDENVATQSLMSQLSDTDFTAAITQFQALQTSLQATLQVSAKTLNESLMDFLT